MFVRVNVWGRNVLGLRWELCSGAQTHVHKQSQAFQSICTETSSPQISYQSPILHCSTREPFRYLDERGETTANVQQHMQITLNNWCTQASPYAGSDSLNHSTTCTMTLFTHIQSQMSWDNPPSVWSPTNRGCTIQLALTVAAYLAHICHVLWYPFGQI